MAQLYPTTTITASGNLESKYLVYLINAVGGNITATLPNLTNDGITFILKRIDVSANIVTINTPDGALINGSATVDITAASGKTLVSRVNAWYIVDDMNPYVAPEGFSSFKYDVNGASIGTGTTVADNIISGWTTSPIPFYGSSNFDGTTYTVPVTGGYEINAVLPIQMSFSNNGVNNTNSASANFNPYIHFHSGNHGSLMVANLSMIAYTAAIAGYFRYPAHRQTVTLSGRYALFAGDTITIRCNVNASSLPMTGINIYIAGGGTFVSNSVSNGPSSAVTPGATFSIRRMD